MRAPISLGPGDVVDHRYRITEPLGAGGSGAVYSAIDESSPVEQRVAIKVLEADRLDEDRLSGLELEFSLLARLGHPNVVSALAIGVADNGTAYMVEELVLGPTLETARHTLAPKDYYWIAHGILEGLAHVHRRGWVHHDIKPANVLLANTTHAGRGTPVEQWVPKLADLGVASLRGSDPDGKVSGTIPFLSPERLVGQLADPRSDVWALGMSLLFCIGGTLPIDVDSVREAAKILRSGPLPALRDVCPSAPQELEDVIGRMLSLDRKARYRDGTDALAGLRRAMSRAGLVVPELPAKTLVQTPAMIGRDDALSEVLRRLSSPRARAARAIVVRGESGSGLTRLLKEIALEVQLRGARAVFVDPGVGLAPWQRALKELGHDSPNSRLEQISTSLIGILETEPVVLLVDDIDARDSVATRLLERLRGALSPATELGGLVQTAGVAAEWSEAEPGEQALTLSALSERESETLIRSALGTDVAPQAIVRLIALTNGNPSKLVAAMTTAVASGSLERVAGVWELTGQLDQGTDDDAHLEAILELGPSTRTLVTALAVAGPGGAPVELELAREIAGLERDRFGQAVSALCHLELAALSGTGDPSSTSVALVGHADRIAVAAADDQTIRDLHERAWRAHSHRGSGDSAVRARHAWGAQLDAEAAHLTREAAQSALDVGDYAAALALTDHLDAARLANVSPTVGRDIDVARAHALVELSRPLDAAKLAANVLSEHPGNIRAAHVLVRAAIAAGDAARAQRALDVVIALHESEQVGSIDIVELAALRVEVARANRSKDEVKREATDSLATIASIDASELGEMDCQRLERARGRVHTALGASLALGGDIDAGKRLLKKALHLFTEIGDHARIAEVSAFLAAAADLSGNSADRVIHLNRGLESAERAGADASAARLLNIRGLSLLWCGRTEEAIEAFEEAERRGRLPGLYRVVAVVSGNLVVVHRRAGQYDQALEAARRSLRVKHALGDRNGVVATTLNLSDVFFDLGAYKLSAAAGRRVVRESIAAGNRRVEVNGRVTLAIALVALGQSEQARKALGWVSSEPSSLEHQAELEVKLAIADVLVGEQQIALAGEQFKEIEQAAHERDEPYIAAAAAYRRGSMLGPLGAPDLRRAIEAAGRCSARHILWLSRAQLGLALSNAGDSAAAGAEFARAIEAFEDTLSRVPSRHAHTYVTTGDRPTLLAAMREGAQFTKHGSPDPARSARTTSATTAVEVPTSSLDSLISSTAEKPVDNEHVLVTRDASIDAPDAPEAPDTTIQPVGDLTTLAATDTEEKE